MKLYNKYNKEEQKAKILADKRQRTTLSFYQYAKIEDPQEFRNKFYASLNALEVLGRIYVAKEGINGQISLPSENLHKFESYFDSISFLKGIRLNVAIEDDGKSFYILKIKVRDKIVADGLDDDSFDVTDKGVHLNAQQFNELANQEDTVIVDMRNHYESEVGYFENAIRPDVETFRESLPIVSDLLEEHKNKNIVMYCTGGIRCEKASAYLKHKGYQNVHQLEGGIIEYARQAEKLGLENKFKGKNFVFDDRLGERITNEIVSYCHQCGDPCDDHTNCANDACHILFIQCKSCKTKYLATCSTTCAEFVQLPKEQQDRLKITTEFNGSKFGKGRYKAKRKDQEL